MDFEITESAKFDIEAADQRTVDWFSEQAGNLQVIDEESFNKVASLYSEARKWEKTIDAKRKEANEPSQKEIKSNNEKCRKILESLREIQSVCKKKSEEYRAFLERRRLEGYKEESVIAWMFDEEMPTLPPPENHISGERACSYTRTEKRFKLLDLAQVPLSYLCLNEDAVKQDIKLGVGRIDGLEIYDHIITILRTK